MPLTMSPRGRRTLVVILVAGLAVRIALAASTGGVTYDLDSYLVTGQALMDEGFHVYRHMADRVRELGEPALRWPYPPGYFPVLVAVDAAAGLGVASNRMLIRLPLIGADLLVALVLALHGGHRLGTERRRLWAAALVALGPSFFLISAYQGQLDAVAMLPALFAFIVWRRADQPRRGALAGALIGLGAAIKTVPIVLLAALLPRAGSRAEALRTTACALALPGILLAPFVLAEPRATVDAMRYTGAPGVGGLSLALQPSLGAGWMLGRAVTPSPPTVWLRDHALIVVLVLLAGVAALLWAKRPQPEEAAVLVWLAVYAFAPSFFFQYLIWGLPFFLLAGRLRAAAALQAAVLAPTVIAVLRPWEGSWVMAIYTPSMLLLWASFVVALVAQVRRIGAGEPAQTGQRASIEIARSRNPG